MTEPPPSDPMELGKPFTANVEQYAVYDKYSSIAAANPFTATASYRDTLAERERYFPPAPTIKKAGDDSTVIEEKAGLEISNVDALGLHPVLREPFEGRPRATQGTLRSTSDTAFFSSTTARKVSTRQRARSSVTLGARHASTQDSISIVKRSPKGIKEEDNVESDYDSTPPLKPPRSPFAKLFGEKGILLRSGSTKELPNTQNKKTGFAYWSGKMKQRIEDLGRDVSEKVSRIDMPILVRPILERGPHKFPPISITPYSQGDFYFQLELILSMETNGFLIREFYDERISIDSVKRTVDLWKQKGRTQVVGFRYDLQTQRDLIMMNTGTMHFAGITSRNQAKLFSTLAAWRVLAKEVSIRTFCQPDSVIKKHLHDAEKILELVDAHPDSMLAFQELRGRTLGEMYREGKNKRERDRSFGIERPWTPVQEDTPF